MKWCDRVVPTHLNLRRTFDLSFAPSIKSSYLVLNARRAKTNVCIAPPVEPLYR